MTTSRDVRRKAKSFLRELPNGRVSEASLSLALEKRDYTVIEYASTDNDPVVEKLLKALELLDYAKQVKGFTYQDPQCRLVFVHTDLSNHEKKIVLAHEAGHIMCAHGSSGAVIGRDVQEEYEANEFAHVLLDPPVASAVFAFTKRNKKAVLSVFLALIVLVGCVTLCSFVFSNKKSFGEYYVTANGEKYHKKNCYVIKDKSNVRRLSREEYEQGVYSPCKVCLPDE